MSQNLDFLDARLAEVKALFASMTNEEIKRHGEFVEAQIDDIDGKLRTELSPEDIEDLLCERDRLLEEIPGHGIDILEDEIYEIRMREKNHRRH